MKHYLLIVLLMVSQAMWAQQDSIIKPPYQRFPTFPPVKLMLPDSNYFSKDDLDKKSAVMIMLFSPQCEHCQQETEELVKNIDRFKKITIVMATPLPFDSMMAFREKYGLSKYSNIIIGYDKGYFLPVFFNIRNFPYFAFYNRKKELISVFEGSVGIEKALAELNK